MKQIEFLKINGPLIVKASRNSDGQALGWVIERNGVFLERNRGGIRTFKMLCSVAVFCTDNGIDSFKVVDL